MTARAFRCRECSYPFKTAEQGWERDATLMCPACGSADVSIFDPTARWEVVTMTAADERTVTATESEPSSTAGRAPTTFREAAPVTEGRPRHEGR